jgi:hypothetical protein
VPFIPPHASRAGGIQKGRLMIDYIFQDGNFRLVLEGEEYSVEDSKWEDKKGSCGDVMRQVDYEKNIVKFSLSSTKVWREDVSNPYLRGERLDHPFAPGPNVITKEKTTIFKVYEIPLHKEDYALIYGEDRKIYFCLYKKQYTLVDVFTRKIIGSWSSGRSRWVRCEAIDAKDEGCLGDDLGLITEGMKKTAVLQGFILATHEEIADIYVSSQMKDIKTKSKERRIFLSGKEYQFPVFEMVSGPFGRNRDGCFAIVGKEVFPIKWEKDLEAYILNEREKGPIDLKILCKSIKQSFRSIVSPRC